jgi:hypothetical protein
LLCLSARINTICAYKDYVTVARDSVEEDTVIELRSPSIEVDIDDAAGAQIVRLATPGGVNALAWYDWPVPLPAHSSQSYGDSELDWLSQYRGGWQETFPNAGLAATVDGVPVGFHGECSVAPWSVTRRDESSCELWAAARLPLTITRRMWLASDTAALYVESTARNHGAVPTSFVWGHHPAFPALPGAAIDYPAGATARPDVGRPAGLTADEFAWPMGRTVDGGDLDVSVVPDGPVHRLLYVDGLVSGGWAALRQPAGGVSIAMAWDTDAYPYSWLWVMREDAGFPWFGRASMVSIECQTAWPYDGLASARERNMAHQLQPGESARSWMTIVLLAEAPAAVAGVDRAGQVRWAGDHA